MSSSAAIRLNFALVMAVGILGLFTDEYFWRENGHLPWIYDYAFWLALALNGPSGFAADYLSFLTGTHAIARYLIQYGLWCLLLWPQWRLYEALIRWRQRDARQRTAPFYAIAVAFLVSFAFAARAGWIWGHRPSEGFIDQYFWFVRIAGVGCAAIVVVGYACLANSRRLTIGRSGRER